MAYAPYEHSSTINSPNRETTQEAIQRINSSAVASSIEKVPCKLVREVLRASGKVVVSQWHAVWLKEDSATIRYAKGGMKTIPLQTYLRWYQEIEAANEEKLS